MRLPSLSHAAIRLIRLYQRRIPLGRSAACRYLPTCSEYAVEAIQRHGILCGGTKTTWRLLRCNPLSRGGYDPITPDQQSTAPTS